MFTYTTALATLLPLLPLLPLSLAAPLVRHPAPIHRAVDVGARSTEGDYIVAIKANTVDPNARGRWLNNVLSTSGITLDNDANQSLKLNWDEKVFNGLAGTFSTQALSTLQNQPEVAWIQEDHIMHTSAVLLQPDATWGIARLSTATTDFSGQNPTLLGFPYIFEDAPGLNTEAYILDTGCNTDHSEFQTDFGSRATFVKAFDNTTAADVNGHGTHVAGTIGGNVLGVAKNCTIICIKVMDDDGSGKTSNIVAGINAAQKLATESNKPAVISMSLGGPPNQAIDDAVSNVIVNSRIPFIVAAGNESQDANNVSPARVPAAITVGATNINDTFSSFSNFGSVVDILAPGEEILSASPLGENTVAVLSGTSMATPHVSGLALVIMGKEGKLSPLALSDRLKADAIPGIIKDVREGTTTNFATNGVRRKVPGV